MFLQGDMLREIVRFRLPSVSRLATKRLTITVNDFSALDVRFLANALASHSQMRTFTLAVHNFDFLFEEDFVFDNQLSHTFAHLGRAGELRDITWDCSGVDILPIVNRIPQLRRLRLRNEVTYSEEAIENARLNLPSLHTLLLRIQANETNNVLRILLRALLPRIASFIFITVFTPVFLDDVLRRFSATIEHLHIEMPDAVDTFRVPHLPLLRIVSLTPSLALKTMTSAYPSLDHVLLDGLTDEYLTRQSPSRQMLVHLDLLATFIASRKFDKFPSLHTVQIRGFHVRTLRHAGWEMKDLCCFCRASRRFSESDIRLIDSDDIPLKFYLIASYRTFASTTGYSSF